MWVVACSTPGDCAGMTLEEVAEQTGVSVSGLRRARDVSRCRSDLVTKILDAELSLRRAEKEIYEPTRGGAPVDHVYFIESGSGHIKIGHATHPEQRLEELQVGCPFELILLLSVPFGHGARTVESILHEELSRSCLRGEWFHPTPDVIETIEIFRSDWGHPKDVLTVVEAMEARGTK